MNILEMSDQEIGRRQSLQQVVGHAVLVLDDGQRLEALRQEDELLGVDADLAHLGLEDEATHADEVADVEQLLEDYVV